MWYTSLVNIMSLSGTHTKGDPLWHKGFVELHISGVCSFLYIVDILTFGSTAKENLMHKKCTFYTYVKAGKYSLYSKNVLSFSWIDFLLYMYTKIKSHLSCCTLKRWLFILLLLRFIKYRQSKKVYLFRLPKKPMTKRLFNMKNKSF